MKYFPLTAGLISLLIGLYLFASPLATVSTIGWVLALIVFISGINGIMAYFNDIYGQRNLWMLVQHTLSFVFGLILITSSSFARSSVVITILAYWVLVSGFLRLIASFQLRKVGFPQANRFVGIAALMIIFGIVLLGSPLLSAAIIGRFVSLLFIAIGISAIYTFMQMR